MTYANLNRVLGLALAGALALSSTAIAQDTSAQTEAEPPAEQGSGIASQLSMGTDADTPSDIGQGYTKEKNGDWELRCLRTEVPENDPCQMYQLMDDGEGIPVAEFSLFRLPGDGPAKAGATVIVPLETSLQDQLTIRVDGGNAKRYPFLFCNPLGCYARIGLTEADVAAFKRGSEAKLTIVPALAPDQNVELTLSLNGFTATYDKSSVLDQ
jgi:invasion protein IalB